MIAKHHKLAIFILFVLILVSCAPRISTEQPIHSASAHLQEGKTLGQTFTANYNGLQAVVLYLEPGQPGDGNIVLHLKYTINDTEELATTTRNIQEISNGGFYRFTFPAQQSSNQQDYYIQIEIIGSGSIQVGNGVGNSYLQGALYKNQIPVDAQLTFRLVYDTPETLIGLVKEGLTWILFIIIAAFLFVLPGWILLSLFWNGWHTLHWGTKLGLGIGLSLAIYPLTFLWTDIFNIHLGAFYAWLPPVISIALLVGFRRKRLIPKRLSVPSFKHPFPWADFTLVVIILLIFGVRFWVIRSLDLPLWGDSYQHTMITQLTIENKGLFASWAPYAALETFTYHFGFHSLSTVFHWVTGLPSGEAVLWTGQIINAFAVIALLPLAYRIRRNTWAGAIVLLFAGLLFHMPMYYVNWGRYTQLTGLVLLAAFSFCAWSVLENKAIDRPLLVITPIILSALALSHYRVLIFALLLLPILLLMYVHKTGLRMMVVKLFWIGFGSLILFLPWFINVFSGRLLDIIGYQVTTPTDQLTSTYQQYIGIGDLFTYLPPAAWVVLPFLIGWALWRRRKGIAIISSWWFIIFLAANPQWFKFPGTGTITAFAVLIAIFFPASLIIGESSAWAIEKITAIRGISQPDHSSHVTTKSAYAAVILSILIILVGLWGAQNRRADLDTQKHTLTTRPDMRAANWTKNNLPGDARLLINSFFAYGNSLIVGSDAGWWLPLQANIQTTVPPLNYGSEQGPIPNYIQWVNSLTAMIEQKGINHPQVFEMLESRAISHVYIGQRQGEVNTNEPLLDINQMLASPHYDPIFHQDRVWIFKINDDS